MSFFAELKRRNVFRVGVAYVLGAWVLLQGVDFVLDAIDAPNWILQVFILAAAVGLPAVLIFSWVFEMTPEGVKRESEIDRSQSITATTGRKLDRVIIVFLVAAVAVLLADRFINHGPEPIEKPALADTTADPANVPVQPVDPAANAPISEKSIAVLPFLSLSSGQDDEYFADGLTEEILNSLAQLPELLVTARTSSFHFKGRDLPIQEIATTLGVGTIVEGSVRRSGDRLRVTAQLIRASDGFHIWSEDYDSTSDDTIAVQENIAEKIATAMNVVLDEEKRKAMRRAGLRNVEAFIAMQKAVELFENAHGEKDISAGLDAANRYFEQVLRIVPDYAVAYQLHADADTHRLIGGASGDPTGVTDPAAVEAARASVLADYEKALENAQTPQQRNNAELDLAYLTGDWRGMPARIERFAAERGCDQPSWADNVAIPFGYAALVEPRSREFTVCDPMASSTWRSEVRSLLWSGDFEEALGMAQKGMAVAPGDWLSMQLIATLVAVNRYEEAESEITGRVQSKQLTLTARMLIAAARGDRERFDRLLELYHQDPDPDGMWDLNFAAWSGERDRANEIAARMDAHAFGSQALSTSFLWCLCGASFDIEATPNFAANIRQSGLTWPPVSPIHFPLKSW